MQFSISSAARSKLYAILTLIAAFLLAAFGQYQLMQSNLTAGLAAYTGAAIVFCLVIRSAGAPSPEPVYQAQGSFSRISRLIWLAAIIAILVAIMVPYSDPGPNERWETLIGWLASVVLFSIGVLRSTGWRPPSWQTLKAWVLGHQGEIIAVTSLCLFALALRTIDLEFHPYPFANDEGWVGLDGRNILQGAFSSFFRVGYGTQPVITFAPTALSMAIFGQNIFAVRLVSAVYGTLTVLFLYLAGREMFGRRVGFLSAAILTVMPVHIHFSRTGFDNIITGFYAALLVWLVFRALRRGKISSYLWAGLVTGTALYTYLGSRLDMVLASGILGLICLTQRRYLKDHRWHLVIFAAAVLIMAGPQISYFISRPDDFMARISTESILQNGWLTNLAQNGLPAVINGLLDQLARSSLVYISTPAPYGFYNSPFPYLQSFEAVFMVLGMAFAFWRIRRPPYATLLAWFWSVTIIGGMLTSSPPASQRLILGFPAAALMVAIGLDQAVSLLEKKKIIPARMVLLPLPLGTVICALAIIGIGISGLNFYFFDYRQKVYIQDVSNELIYESTLASTSLGSNYQFVLLGAPQTYTNFANYLFFLPKTAKIDINDPITAAAPDTLPKSPAFFVAIPSRRGELQLIADALPGGNWLEVHRRSVPSEILYVGYIYPSAQINLPAALPDTPLAVEQDFITNPALYMLLILAASFSLLVWSFSIYRRRWVERKINK